MIAPLASRKIPLNINKLLKNIQTFWFHGGNPILGAIGFFICVVKRSTVWVSIRDPPNLVCPHLVYPHLVYIHLVYTHLVCTHLVCTHLVNPYLVYPHLAYPHLVLPSFGLPSLDLLSNQIADSHLAPTLNRGISWLRCHNAPYVIMPPKTKAYQRKPCKHIVVVTE